MQMAFVLNFEITVVAVSNRLANQKYFSISFHKFRANRTWQNLLLSVSATLHRMRRTMTQTSFNSMSILPQIAIFKIVITMFSHRRTLTIVLTLLRRSPPFCNAF